jgi:F-type H+-transporting ATPase subunit b
MTGSDHKAGWKPVVIIAVFCLMLAGLSAVGLASEGSEASHHADNAAQLKDFMWRVIDFAVLALLILWVLKKANLRGALADRRAAVEKSLKEAVAARENAEKKFAEYSSRLAEANREIDGIYASIKHEGEMEKTRIIAEAREMAVKICEQAVLTANQEVVKARTQLREEAVRLAVQLAEQKLKDNMSKEDQDRLVGEYLTKVVELH